MAGKETPARAIQPPPTGCRAPLLGACPRGHRSPRTGLTLPPSWEPSPSRGHRRCSRRPCHRPQQLRARALQTEATVPNPVAPFVVLPGEGTPIQMPLGGSNLLKAHTRNTNGSLTVIQCDVPPKQGPALHIHTRENELWYVLEGDFRFKTGDAMLGAPQGACIFGPRGIPHSFQNIGDTPDGSWRSTPPRASSGSSSSTPSCSPAPSIPRPSRPSPSPTGWNSSGRRSRYPTHARVTARRTSLPRTPAAGGVRATAGAGRRPFPIGAGQIPPFTARRLKLSTLTRSRSTRPAWPSSSSSTPAAARTPRRGPTPRTVASTWSATRSPARWPAIAPRESRCEP
jgi:mannose-6-phosphate isomerase-like protein (cupin superfamily)